MFLDVEARHDSEEEEEDSMEQDTEEGEHPHAIH